MVLEDSFFAHSAPPSDPTKGSQLYREHSTKVRDDATCHAEAVAQFYVGNYDEFVKVVRFAGEFHDLGKLHDANQKVLGGCRGGRLDSKFDHIDAGVAHALNEKKEMAAWLIRAHHAPGLPSAPKERNNEKGPLRGIRDREAFRGAHDDLVNLTDKNLRKYLSRHFNGEPIFENADALEVKHGMAMRFALSCLVDADHTDTANWDNAESLPSSPQVDWKDLAEQLDSYISQFPPPETERDVLRSSLFDGVKFLKGQDPIVTCEAGVGLGKTTAVTRYLLDRAEQKQLRRLFVVAPFTNILHQTASVYRRIFSDEVSNSEHFLSENHHRAEFENGVDRQYSALWKAPVVLTTAVQFFETLAASKPSQLRKLHTLPGSAIFIDEAHACLPPSLWRQGWKWLQELSQVWGCEIVLASGSMCRVWESEEFTDDPEDVFDITPSEIQSRSKALEPSRVTLEKIENGLPADDLIRRFEEHLNPDSNCESVLAIVNTVQSAAVVAVKIAKRIDGYDPLTESGPALHDRRVLHLSTALTPTHRERILEEIARRNEEQISFSWILVATSCVEAGVDLDFQIGYRERCSVSSFLQTVGRINRNHRWQRSYLYDFTLIRDALLTEHPAFSNSRQVFANFWPLIQDNSTLPSDLVLGATEAEVEMAGGIVESISRNEKNADYPAVANEFRIMKSDTYLAVVSSEIADKIRKYEKVPYAGVIKNSVQLWAAKLDNLGMVPIREGSEIYEWSSPYDENLIGIMKGILPLIEASNLTGALIVENTQ